MVINKPFPNILREGQDLQITRLISFSMVLSIDTHIVSPSALCVQITGSRAESFKIGQGNSENLTPLLSILPQSIKCVPH